MYYLQSRYYDPAIGRFINADILTTTDSTGFLGYNMFAYCENNPVNNYDPAGQWTLAIGISGAIAYGGGFGLSAQIVIDGHGNCSLLITRIYYAGTSNIAWGYTATITNADSVNDLSGNGYLIGGSGGPIGVDYGTGTSPITGRKVDSLSITALQFAEYLVDLHVGQTKSTVISLSRRLNESKTAQYVSQQYNRNRTAAPPAKNQNTWTKARVSPVRELV